MLRYLRITLEFFAAFAGVMVLAGLILIWHLDSAPESSSFLTPYVESGVAHFLPDTRVHFANTLVSWDNVAHAVTLHADGMEVKDMQGHLIAQVPTLDMRLSVFGILFGQVMPRTLIIMHPQVRMEHRADGNLHFAGLSTQAQAESKTDMQAVYAHLARSLAHAYFLRKLQIGDASLDVYDESGAKLWSIHVPEVALDRAKGGDLAGHIDISLNQKGKISTLDVQYDYDRAESLHRLKTQFDNINPSFVAGGHPGAVGLGEASMINLPLAGEITAAFDNDAIIRAGTAKIQGGSGSLNVPLFWDQPRTVASLKLEAVYDARKLDISMASIDFGGPKLDLTVKGREPRLSTHDMDFTLIARLANWPMDQYSKLWPKPIVPGARDWIATNLTKGMFDRGEATFHGSAAWKDLSNVEITEGQGTISASHADVGYVPGMPPVHDVSTDATFDLSQMALQIKSGSIGNLRLAPFTIKITGFENDTQYIDIPLNVVGPIPEVLALIDKPPLGFAKAAGLSPGDITGTLNGGAIDLKFPLLNALMLKDIAFSADVNLIDVASSKLVKGVDITQGALELTLDANGYTVKGPAAFNGATLQLTATQSFNPQDGKPLRQASLTGAIKDDQWSKMGLDAFNGTKGDVQVALHLTQPDAKKTLLDGSLDMTEAEAHIGQLNWKKTAGATAKLSFAAEMEDGKGTLIKSVSLTAPQTKVKGSGSLTSNGGVQNLSFDPFFVGRSNATLDVTRAGDILRFEAYGAALDISGLRGGKEPEHTTPQPKEFRVKTDRLYTSDDGFITHAQGYAIRDAEGWSSISLHGMAMDNHKLSIDLTPQDDGTRKFAITCDDFGAALHGMGFTNTVRNGELKIFGASTPDNPRIITGTAKVGGFEVRGLPVLMLLINATTPFGITGLLTGTASFDRLKGNFKWEGDGIDLMDVNAAGTVGINVDGKVDMNSGEAKLHGTIVPFNTVNGILNAIPLIGDLITGGEHGGVLAVAYTIDGPLTDPKISVNPVSLLTPGFLRELFFGGGDDKDDEPDETSKSENQPSLSTSAPK